MGFYLHAHSMRIHQSLSALFHVGSNTVRASDPAKPGMTLVLSGSLITYWRLRTNFVRNNTIMVSDISFIIKRLPVARLGSYILEPWRL